MSEDRWLIFLTAALLAGCESKPAGAPPPPAAPAAATKPAPPADAAKPAPAKDEGWQNLFDGKALGNWKSVEFGGEGKAYVENGELRIDEGASCSGVHWKGAPPPKTNYELTLEAKKIDGNDFFCGLIFPVGEDFCSFVAGGWGGGIVGLSSVDGMNASENDTTKVMNFPKGRWYQFRLKVTPAKIEVWIDKDKMVDLELKDHKISIHPAVESAEPLGLTTYSTSSAFRDIRLRKLP